MTSLSPEGLVPNSSLVEASPTSTHHGHNPFSRGTCCTYENIDTVESARRNLGCKKIRENSIKPPGLPPILKTATAEVQS